MLDFRQDDDRLPPLFHRYGCHLLTLASMANALTQAVFHPTELMYVYIDGVAHEYVDTQCSVRQPDYVLRTLLQRKGLQKDFSVYQIGADGRFWMWVKHRDYQATVLKYRTRNGNHHFLEGNAEAQVLYNPDPEVDLNELESVIYYQLRRLT